MKDILILFSSIKEASSLIHQAGLNFEKSATNVYSYKNVIIYITGIGKRSIDKLDLLKFKDFSFIIKAGTCAVLDENISICNSLVPVYITYKLKKIKQDYSRLPFKIEDSIKKLITDKTLLTLDKPLLNSKKSSELFNCGISFVDMETFFIIDKFKNIPVIPLLVGTDRGDENAKKLFKKMLPKASEILKDEIIKILGINRCKRDNC